MSTMSTGSVADAIDLFRQGCAAIAAIDRTACTPDELSRLVVGVGRLSDRLRAVHALHVQQADRATVWYPSGARNVTGWYADQMAVGYGDAVRIVKLGDVLEASERVLTAVLTGRLSAATAESLHTAVVRCPAGADIDAFLDKILGPRPASEPVPDPSGEAEEADISPDSGNGDDGGVSDEQPSSDAEPEPEPESGPERGGFAFGPEPDPAARPAGFGPKAGREAADEWKQSQSDPADEAERLRSKRAVTASPPSDGLVTTSVVLPVLEHRQFLSTLDHIAGSPCEADERSAAQRRADALVALCNAYTKGTVTGGREHPKIIVTIDLDSYLGTANQPGLSSMGDRIPAQVIRELAEQAELRWMLHTGTEILQLGRTHRLASDAQWEALIARDGCCRWPGCTIPAAWCEVDHLDDWDHGGPTDIDLLALECGHHHTVRHRPGTRVHGDAHDFTIELPDGTLVHCPPKGTLTPRREPESGEAPGEPGKKSKQSKQGSPEPPDEAAAAHAPTRPGHAGRAGQAEKAEQVGLAGQAGQAGQAGLFDVS